MDGEKGRETTEGQTSKRGVCQKNSRQLSGRAEHVGQNAKRRAITDRKKWSRMKNTPSAWKKGGVCLNQKLGYGYPQGPQIKKKKIIS